MILWRNIQIIHFYHFDSTPDFPHFYYMLGGNLGSLLYGDVFVMLKYLQDLEFSKKNYSNCVEFRVTEED